MEGLGRMQVCVLVFLMVRTPRQQLAGPAAAVRLAASCQPAALRRSGTCGLRHTTHAHMHDVSAVPQASRRYTLSSACVCGDWW
jgi:hypothetical protein